ncbi:unnamed protein product [Medioppia subpectinata]|uniref:DmX-like protein 2 n=1 Tax=Medioppia subpectinata TaxID=1979941 RepID=A0A7R9KV32_9ACAR|nr:unnamed protein product [Medioppia subpectinata]CAG2109036.1 unnamed protein product [Medioppia subpectinata]
MEELSTLATGFEVDGGQLRYQLYVWLEKSVQALKSICNYRTFSMRHTAEERPDPSSMVFGNSTEISPSDRLTPRGSHSEASGITETKPSLHEILLADKMDFEAKLDRSSRRKLWLTSNEALMRTLLSYCSLHGAHGGGLSSVRMELILLLQELQQERSQQQLLSPLPFPTTLPLLAASVACQKTVIADPIRHLQSVTHDILNTVLDMSSPPLTITPNYSIIYVLRDLGISLSSCIYQSLCDSDAITSKPDVQAREDLMSSVVCQNTHLLAGHQTVRRNISTASESNETLTPITAPNKWPGVQSLRALLARDKDEDSPKLHSLLCESFVAVFLSQFIYSSAACDSYVLYRLIGMDFKESTWAQLFGGGAKKLIHVATGQPSQTQSQTPQQNSEDSAESSSMDLFNTLSKQRMKLHMKILQQLSQTDKPIPPPNMKEDRPTYREQFIPPQTSMVSYFMTKPTLPDEYILLDYDSSESVQTDDEGNEGNAEEDDFGVNDSVFAGNTGGQSVIDEKKMQQELYAWGLVRFSVLRLAKQQLLHFLSVAGIEISDLPITSPLIHSVLKTLNNWESYMNDYMNEFNGPPQHFLPNNYVETNRQNGPAIHKYKALLELNNTPFRDHNTITKASKRLWNYLIRQERVQDIFIRFIFGKPKSVRTVVSEHDSINDVTDTHNPEPTRIVHKDHENISAFCINRTNPGFIAISTPKEIQEMDISMLLESTPFLEDEAEYDILNLQKTPESLPSIDYLLVQHPADRLQSSPGGLAIHSSAVNSANASGAPNASNAAKNPIMLKRHKTEGVRRLCSHPMLPLYLSGSQDGSVTLWEWKHHQSIACPRPAGTFAKVSRVAFNQQGNKFGVTDADGNLSLWQIATTQNKPFFSMQCHSKTASDFTFLGSSSLVMTAGQSADHKNIALWDTLLPHKKCLVTSFACHEHSGASAILYAPLNQLLITGGKKGDVFMFDMRQRVQRDRFQAHESAVKCMALDPGEEFFVTGSADGDIKVWGLGSVRVLFYSFPGEHSRSTLFRNIGMGVSHLYVDQNGRLFSCGADGSMKFRQLPDRGINNIINTI